jgi:hypothetical protein
MISQPNKTNPETLGRIKLNYIIYFYFTIILFTPAYTYYMSVTLHQEPPFPHTTVTDTACHYPQAIIFRWTMTPATGFLTFIFYMIFRFYEK